MQNFFKKNKKEFSRLDRGFTLIELLVVLVIISVMTFLLLIQQSKFDSSTVLRSLAYNIALSVRQAQVYGVSVKENALGTGTFAQGYGLYFDPSAANQNSYKLFADLNNNGRYDSGEETSIFQTNNGYVLSEVCVTRSSDGAKLCSGSDDTSGTRISTLAILFNRPNPDAQFVVSLASNGPPPNPNQFTSAYIQIQATDGTTRGIHVYVTGQVSVDTINPATPI
jgi:prepilin-type N-terminal cleavage/methylation domain-containing protein